MEIHARLTSFAERLSDNYHCVTVRHRRFVFFCNMPDDDEHDALIVAPENVARARRIKG